MSIARTRFAGAAAALAGLALVLSGCGGASTAATPQSSTPAGSPTAAATEEAGGPVTIGAFGFGESAILAHIYAGALAAAGYEPTVVELTNREVVEPALESGEVEVVPEYLGTLTEFLNAKDNGPDATPLASGDVEATLAHLRELAAKRNLVVLTPSPAADQNAFAVTRVFAEKNGIATLSDLGAYSATNPVVLGGPPECPTRPFCQPGLEQTYGVTVGEFVSLDAGGPLTKTALSQGKIDIGLVFSSDGGVAANDLVVLTDDKALQTADNIVAVVNAAVARPSLQAALDAVAAALTTDQLVALNKAVDIDHAEPADVAQEWLVSQGIVK